MLADSSANWTVLPQYDPFGKSKATSLTKFGYTGEQMDASGLEFLRARYYDTDLGQFISHDPESGSASDPITMNGYAYGSQNPINRTDPSGRCDGDLIWNAQLYLQSCQNDLEQGRQDWNKGGIVNFDQGILDGTGLNRTYDAVGGEYNNISNAAGKFYDNPNLQTYSNLNKTGILAELALFADLSILLPPGESSAEAEVTKAIEPCAIDELMEGMMKAELKDHTFIVYKWMEKLRELGLFERPSGYTEEAYQRAIILHDYIKSVWDEIMWTTDLRDPKISAELKAEVEERIANHAKESAIKLGEKGFGKDSLEYITAMCHHMTSPECIDLLSKPGNESLKSFMTWLSFTDALQANLGNRAYQILDSIEGLEASKQFNLAWDRTSTTRSGQFLAHIDELKKSLPSDYKEIIQIYLGYYSGK